MLVSLLGVNITQSFVLVVSFIVPAISLTIIIAGIISNKKVSFLGSLLFLVSLFALLVRKVNLAFFTKLNQNYLVDIPHINKIIYITSAVALLIIGLSFLYETSKRKQKQSLIQLSKKYEHTNVVAYISKKGKLVQISKKVYDLLYNQQKDLALKSLQIGEEVLPPKNIIKNLAKYQVELDEPVKYVFAFENNLEIEFTFVKKEVFNEKDKLVGYIILDTVTAAEEHRDDLKELKRNFYIYMDLLNEPLAYYDEEQKAYIASRALLNHLRVDNNVIPLEQFRQLIHKDDLEIFDKRQIEANKYQLIQYRLLTKDEYVWFEEGSGSFFDKTYIVTKIMNAESSLELNFGSYKSYVSTVEDYILQGKDFAIALVNLHSLPRLINEQGKEFANIVLNKYFSKIYNGVLKNQVELFKIGSLEYALVIEGQEYYDLVVRDLNTKSSELVSQELIINKIKVKLEAYVALVSAKEIPLLSARNVIKAAFDCVKEASDPEFLSDYSIYQAKEDVEIVYSLKDFGIDFEADDLSVFVEDVKK